MQKPNVIKEKSFDFALNIIQLYKQLVENKEFILSKQLLKSGTSIGANVNEATAAQTKKGFYYKNVNRLKRSKRNIVLALSVG